MSKDVMHYWNLFMDTCYGDERVKLERVIGDRYFKTGGRICVLVGGPASGKTLILNIIQVIFRKDPSVSILYAWLPPSLQYSEINDVIDKKKYIFIESNHEPPIWYPNCTIVHTSGNRVPFKEYYEIIDKLSDPDAVEVIIQHCKRIAETYKEN